MDPARVVRRRSMHARGKAIVLVLSNVLLAGCAGRMVIEVDQDPAVAFDAYRTYEWAPRLRAIQDVRVTPALRRQIRDDVDRNLTDRGYLRVDSDADFTVSFQVTIEGQTIVQTLDGYVGSIWTEDLARPGTSLRRYEEGTLIIDALDGESERLIWRGSATAEVRQRVGVEDRSERVAEAVRKVLERFPSR